MCACVCLLSAQPTVRVPVPARPCVHAARGRPCPRAGCAHAWRCAWRCQGCACALIPVPRGLGGGLLPWGPVDPGGPLPSPSAGPHGGSRGAIRDFRPSPREGLPGLPPPPGTLPPPRFPGCGKWDPSAAPPLPLQPGPPAQLSAAGTGGPRGRVRPVTLPAGSGFLRAAAAPPQRPVIN